MQALGFWWTVSNERVREKRAPSQAGERRRVHPGLQGAARHRRPDGGRRRRPARRGGEGPRAGRRQRRRHARSRRALRRGLHPAPGAHRREGGEHQPCPDQDHRRVHRRVRLRPRGGPGLPRGHARVDGRPQGRVRADAAVLRQHGRQPHRGGVLGPAGVVLRGDRPRQGRARRGLLLRHQRAVPPGGVRERGRVPHELADRGLRALDPPARAGVELGVRAGRARARPRPRGHRRLRLPATALGQGLPVGHPARAESTASPAS